MRVAITLFAGNTAVLIPSSNGQIALLRGGMDEVHQEVSRKSGLPLPICRSLLYRDGLQRHGIGALYLQAFMRLFAKVRAILLPYLPEDGQLDLKIVGADFPGLEEAACTYLQLPKTSLNVTAIPVPGYACQSYTA